MSSKGREKGCGLDVPVAAHTHNSNRATTSRQIAAACQGTEVRVRGGMVWPWPQHDCGERKHLVFQGHRAHSYGMHGGTTQDSKVG
jgi:hypothetical protein